MLMSESWAVVETAFFFSSFFFFRFCRLGFRACIRRTDGRRWERINWHSAFARTSQGRGLLRCGIVSGGALRYHIIGWHASISPPCCCGTDRGCMQIANRALPACLPPAHQAKLFTCALSQSIHFHRRLYLVIKVRYHQC